MQEQRKPLIAYAVMAEGNRANMQDIYHPWTLCRGAHETVCMCAGVGLSVYWSDYRSERSQIHRENVQHTHARIHTRVSPGKYDNMQPDI